MESTNAAENTEKTKNSSDSLAAMIANMNQTMAAMVGNISSMGNALKRMHADTASPSNAKRQKSRLLVAMSSAMRRLGMNRRTQQILAHRFRPLVLNKSRRHRKF